MFENLSDRLERSFKILKGEGRITEINIAETVKDIRKALLEADVNYKTAKQFTDRVKEKALGQNVINAVRPGQLMVKITHDELADLMGGEAVEMNLKGRPAVILMSGLQGSGKTTFAAKLANYAEEEAAQEAAARGLRRLSSGRYPAVARGGRADQRAKSIRSLRASPTPLRKPRTPSRRRRRSSATTW